MAGCWRGIILPLFLGTLCSCLGSRAEIVLKADGAGTLNLEYRISRQVQNIGALDGNARWPGVPVDRADFERGIARLNAARPGAVKLLSFSAREEGPDMVYRAAAAFSRLEDILPLLDYNGGGIRYIRGEKQSLTLNFAPKGELGGDSVDPALLVLAEEAFRGYNIAISLSSPSPVELRVQGEGDARIEREGGKAGFSVPLYRLISLSGPLTAEFIF
ncbi:MAG: hypothetical protein LBH51_00225 [Treponema sp.]|jgi:hypothetical protein|nr:hypothetical protein [Treponema sp.]